jgi:hypothetical protein
VHLTDRGIQIDGQRLVARSSASRPRPIQDRGEETIQLADVTERERAQERATRRRCHHPMPQHLVGGTRAQHINIVDAVTPNRHRREQRQDLAARPRRTRPAAQIDELVGCVFDTERLATHRDQAQPGVRHRVVVVEDDFETRRIVQR